VTNAWLEVALGGEKTFNVIRAEEMILLGQRIAKYQVEALVDGQWKPISLGTTIGYRKLDRFPKVTASKVRLTILEARGCPALKSLAVHFDTVSPPESFEPGKVLQEIRRGARAPRPASVLN